MGYEQKLIFILLAGLLNFPVLFFRNYRFELLLYLITGIAFARRFYMASEDPFLHNRDERFHARVARNQMDHPLQPLLRKNPFIEFDSTKCCFNQNLARPEDCSRREIAGY